MNGVKKQAIKLHKLRLKSNIKTPKKSISPNPREKISSYFCSSKETQNATQSEELFSSSEKESEKVSTSTSNDNSINEDDFIENGPPLKKNTKFQVVKNKINNKKSTNTREISQYLKTVQTQFQYSDTNEEHLQLALVMSKSINEIENPQLNEDNNSTDPEIDFSYPSTQEKLSNIKRTLHEFGFKSGKTPVNIPLSNVKQLKKKFKFHTPSLFRRSDEDRTKIIENRVSEILMNISIYNDNLKSNIEKIEFVNNRPKSILLDNYYDENSTNFRKNSLDIHEMNEFTFYNNTVISDVVKAGILLKNWNSIPGREKTPSLLLEKDKNDENKDNKKLDVKENSVSDIHSISTRSLSPELFSDNDSNEINNQINNCTNKNDEEVPYSVDLFSNESKILTDNNEVESNFNKIEDFELSTNISQNFNKVHDIISPTSQKRQFSDESDTNSISLIDSISPKRKKKNKTFHKEGLSKKYLFNDQENSDNNVNSVSLLDNKLSTFKSNYKNSKFNKTKNSIESTFLDEQNSNGICHYESYLDNSNDIFDLTQSSNNSNALFNSTDEITAKENVNQDNTNKYLRNQVDEKNNELLFSMETELLKNVLPNKQLEIECLDLTQTSNDSTDSKNISSVSKEIECDKKEKKSLQRSFSENIDYINTNKSPETSFINQLILENEMNLSSKLKFHQSLQNLEISDDKFNNLKSPQQSNHEEFDFDIKLKKVRKSQILQKHSSQSSIDLSSDISDDELNYSCNTSLIRKRKLLKRIDEKLKDKNNIQNALSESHLSEINFLNNSNFEDFNYSFSDLTNFSKKNKKEVISNSSSDDNNSFESIITDTNKVELVATLNKIEVISSSSSDDYNNFEPNINENEVLKHHRVNNVIINSKKENKRELISSSSSNDSCKEELENIEKTKVSVILENNMSISTPNKNIVIKTRNITPRPNYSDMDSPERNKELEKYGIKRMSRARGLKILRYIYDKTHPICMKTKEKVLMSESDREDKIVKRRKNRNINSNIVLSSESKNKSGNVISLNFGQQIIESEELENMVYERTKSTKIHSCSVPLHIAWYNLLMNQTDMLEKILLYEPVQVEDIYAKLKLFGYKYHIQDLITFLDKKCVTIKMKQNNRFNKKANSN